MKWLLCRWFGHHWRCLDVTLLERPDVVLWQCSRCGRHQWRELWKECP